MRGVARALGIALSAGALAIPSAAARAQSGLATEGAVFLLLPVGARAVGLGQAVAANQHGADGVWWNPAALGVLERREVGVHHAQVFVGTLDALDVAVPFNVLGVIALSASILNYGDIETTSAQQGQTGAVSPRSAVLGATYATTAGRRATAGITYKIVRFQFTCTGDCGPLGSFAATTSAVDLGAQYDLGGFAPMRLGATLRNVGLRLQVNDREQADPLPTRLQVGAEYRVPGVQRYAAATEVTMSADLVGPMKFDEADARFGVDVRWQKRASARAGYAFGEGDGSGASLGLGYEQGQFGIDLARLFTGLSAESGRAPTYISLRYSF